MTTIIETAVAKYDEWPQKTPHIQIHDLPTPEEPNIPLPPPSTNPSKILDVDQGTPDNHVPRDPRLIRLTGVHPFNVEAPLTALYNEGMLVNVWKYLRMCETKCSGFLTSPELFYVRNHGPVPQVHDEDIPNWEISIEGYNSFQPCLFGVDANR